MMMVFALGMSMPVSIIVVQQDVVALVIERGHDLFQLGFAHLAVGHRDAQFRQQFPQLARLSSIVFTSLCR